MSGWTLEKIAAAKRLRRQKRLVPEIAAELDVPEADLTLWFFTGRRPSMATESAPAPLRSKDAQTAPAPDAPIEGQPSAKAPPPPPSRPPAPTKAVAPRRISSHGAVSPAIALIGRGRPGRDAVPVLAGDPPPGRSALACREPSPLQLRAADALLRTGEFDRAEIAVLLSIAEARLAAITSPPRRS